MPGAITVFEAWRFPLASLGIALAMRGGLTLPRTTKATTTSTSRNKSLMPGVSWLTQHVLLLSSTAINFPAWNSLPFAFCQLAEKPPLEGLSRISGELIPPLAKGTGCWQQPCSLRVGSVTVQTSHCICSHKCPWDFHPHFVHPYTALCFWRWEWASPPVPASFFSSNTKGKFTWHP